MKQPSVCVFQNLCKNILHKRDKLLVTIIYNNQYVNLLVYLITGELIHIVFDKRFLAGLKRGKSLKFTRIN